MTSRGSSLTEVAGDAAVFVDPCRVSDIARGLVEICTMPAERRAELIEKGFKRVEKFTWAQCAEQTVRAYAYAVGR